MVEKQIVYCTWCEWLGLEEDLIRGDDDGEAFDGCPNCDKKDSHLMDVDQDWLKEKWKEFGDIPIDEKENIEQQFLSFPKGTNRFDIWHLFDQLLTQGLGKYLEGK